MSQSQISGYDYRALVKARPIAAVLVGLVWLIAAGVPLGHSIPNLPQTLGRFVLIVGLAVSYSLVMRGAERLRLASAGGPYQDFVNAWVIAAALLLPLAPAAVAITIIYTVSYRAWRTMSNWRPAYVNATTVVAGYAAAWTHAEIADRYLGLLAATIAFLAVQALLIFALMWFAGARQDARTSFSSPMNWFVNLSTAAVGAALVDVILRSNWWALAAVLVVKVCIHRLAQHLQMVTDESIDTETDALADQLWRRLAEQMFTTSQAWTVVLIAPVESSRLATVASVAELVCTDGEAVGRVGEQIALLVKGPRIIARNLALRVVADLDALGIDAAAGTGAGETLDAQLEAAESDLLLSYASH